MKAFAQITLNKVTYIQDDEFAGFKIFASMKNGLPYGYFNAIDRTGKLLFEFDNLQVGAEVQIAIINMEFNKPICVFPLFYILQIEDNCEMDTSILAGGIKVWFGHPWFLYKDVKNHAYKPINNGELIKKILKNEDRGLPFNINDDYFSKTDDKGKIARFKTCETDWDFIQNKLLPYSTSDQMPVHFYCNEFGDFFLRSFKDLYKQNPKMIFTQQEEKAGQYVKEISELCDNYGLDKAGGHLPVKEINIKIGDPSITKEFYPSFYLENNTTGKFLQGGKKLANKISAKSGDSFGNLLPIDSTYFMKTTGSSVKVIHNRQLQDALSLIFETGKYVDNMFEITVTSMFAGHKVRVGDTAELFIGKVRDEEDKKKKHWANGKWLILDIEHFSDDKDKTLLMTKTILVRPAFVGADSSTSLTTTTMMFSTPA